MKKIITLITLVLSIAIGAISASNFNQSQLVQASSLKRAYFPKSLRGNWHTKNFKLKITANTITGTNFGNYQHTKIYKGSSYLNSHIKPTNKKVLLWKQNGFYYFSLFGAQPAKMKLHSHNVLEVQLGISSTYYYR